MAKPVMMVHGGAWSIPDNLLRDSYRGIKEAVRAGYAVLESGGSALDAVQAAVVMLEDDPDFDAGKCSCTAVKTHTQKTTSRYSITEHQCRSLNSNGNDMPYMNLFWTNEVYAPMNESFT